MSRTRKKKEVGAKVWDGIAQTVFAKLDAYFLLNLVNLFLVAPITRSSLLLVLCYMCFARVYTFTITITIIVSINKNHVIIYLVTRILIFNPEMGTERLRLGRNDF